MQPACATASTVPAGASAAEPIPDAARAIATPRRWRLAAVEQEIDELLLSPEAPQDAEGNAARLAELFAERDRLRMVTKMVTAPGTSQPLTEHVEAD